MRPVMDFNTPKWSYYRQLMLRLADQPFYLHREKTYDGLYRIVKAWRERGKDQFLVCR